MALPTLPQTVHAPNTKKTYTPVNGKSFFKVDALAGTKFTMVAGSSAGVVTAVTAYEGATGTAFSTPAVSIVGGVATWEVNSTFPNNTMYFEVSATVPFVFSVSNVTTANPTGTVTNLDTGTGTGTGTGTTTLTPEQLAIIEADKIALADLKLRVKTGIAVDDNGVLFLILGESALANLVATALDQGGGFPQLKSLGLSDTDAIRCLSVYNVKVDPIKYENEKALEYLMDNIVKLPSFVTYLSTNSLPAIDLQLVSVAFRSNVQVFNALRVWKATNP